MGDMLKDGLAWMAGQLKQHAARDVTYARGGLSVAVKATLGKSMLKLDDQFAGTRIEWTDRDFLIAAADLVLDGYTDPVTPRKGDLITLVEAYDEQTFEVAEYGNEPAWRYADPHRTLLRIHTKRITVT